MGTQSWLMTEPGCEHVSVGVVGDAPGAGMNVLGSAQEPVPFRQGADIADDALW